MFGRSPPALVESPALYDVESNSRTMAPAHLPHRRRHRQRTSCSVAETTLLFDLTLTLASNYFQICSEEPDIIFQNFGRCRGSNFLWEFTKELYRYRWPVRGNGLSFWWILGLRRGWSTWRWTSAVPPRGIGGGRPALLIGRHCSSLYHSVTCRR